MRTSDQRRAERIKKLLAGELVDVDELDYELDAWHLGIVAVGPGGPAALRELAAKLDRRLLLACPGGEAVWAWLGGRRKVEAQGFAFQVTAEHFEVLLAIGEPARGISGWRSTHRQAQAALPVAMRGETQVVSYSEVAIIASVLKDDVLAGALSERYLAPLAEERDGGTALRKTLRAYFAAGRNVASTAAALGVSRQTATSRLNAVEEKIGRPLEICGTELETALRLEDLA
jgi:sugar diacid utilization regulator